MEMPTQHENVTRQLTPTEYADAVYTFANLPTGAGRNHQRLSEFLKRDHDFPIEICPPESNSEPRPLAEEPFLRLYELDPNRREIRGIATSGKDFQSVADFEVYPHSLQGDHRPQLLLLRGYPSPEWLNTIGAKYNVDPEFFARHMEFLGPPPMSPTATPRLYSSIENMIHFNLTTIGSRDSDMRQYKQAEIDDIRKSGNIAMRNYTEKMVNGEGIATGNAIIRKYATFDEVHFIVEQRVSIYMQERGHSWILFIWIDSGNPLENSLKGPWSERSTETQLHPIINYKPMDGLRAKAIMASLEMVRRSSTLRTQVQNTALLDEIYGQFFNLEDKCVDPIYTLSNVFTHFNCAESQLLELIDAKLRIQFEKSDEDFDGLPNYKYFRQILHQHAQQIEACIYSITNISTDHHSSKPKSHTAEKATSTILRNLKYNLETANGLDRRCNEAITILMSTTSIAESRKAMLYQERVGKLTFLAFLFVPLSFTTSFYGMNFKELNPDVQSIWEWFVMSAPVLAITIMAFFMTTKQLLKPWTYLRRQKIH